VENPQVDLVLMDITMAGAEVDAAIRAVREDARFADVRLIVTGMGGDGAIADICLAAGADRFVAKPVALATVVSLCLSLLTATDEEDLDR
jgi:CheY-like chemotaxis protein